MPTGLLRPYYVLVHMGVRVQQQTDEVPVPRNRCLEWGGRKEQANNHRQEYPRWEAVLEESKQGEVIASGSGAGDGQGQPWAVRTRKASLRRRPLSRDRYRERGRRGGERGSPRDLHCNALCPLLPLILLLIPQGSAKMSLPPGGPP